MTKVAFKKWYRNGWFTPISGLIALWTWGKYSHVEIVMSNNKGFSASSWDNEVRIKEINFDNGKWDIIETHRNIDTVIVAEALGKPYDQLGILFWEFFHLPLHGKDRFYCSEIASCVLGLPDCQLDPVKLARFLQEEADVLSGK